MMLWRSKGKDGDKDDNARGIAKRYTVLNETGNVLLATDQAPGQPMPVPVQRVFGEACAFLTAMLRAVSSTPRPGGQGYFSVYDFHALEGVMSRVPLFVKVGTEHFDVPTESGSELLDALVDEVYGIGPNWRARRRLATILDNMADEAERTPLAEEGAAAEVGHVLICCECLMGTPLVSAILTHLRCAHMLTLRMQLKGSTVDAQAPKIVLTRDTFLFVSPSLTKEYAVDVRPSL